MAQKIEELFDDATGDIAVGDLDAAIDAMIHAGNPDLMALARLKKRKLQLKDEITEINNGLLPDIIA